MLSLACVGAALERRHQHSGCGRPGDDPALPCVDVGDAYYLLNPDGDLAPTQAAFERWFASLRGWQVHALHRSLTVQVTGVDDFGTAPSALRPSAVNSAMPAENSLASGFHEYIDGNEAPQPLLFGDVSNLPSCGPPQPAVATPKLP